jgi:hypothetical protein
VLLRWFWWTGAAEDGRAPTEELVCAIEVVRVDGAPEDGRAPTEELKCVRLRCFCSTSRPRRDAFQQKSWHGRSTNRAIFAFSAQPSTVKESLI